MTKALDGAIAVYAINPPAYHVADMFTVAKKIGAAYVEAIAQSGVHLMSAGLMGLLAVLTMTKTPTAKADSQSDVTVFQPNNDAATCSDRCLTQLSLDRSLVNCCKQQRFAIADVAQVMQPNPADVQDTQTLEERNKEIVQQYFNDWRNRTGNFFNLLAPEATWTITGTGAMAGTYRSRQELLDRVINPTSARLSTPIVPTMRGIWADGDIVIVLWDGEATARDGKPYRNTYTWYLQMQNGKAIKAIAFLDMQEFTDLLTRVSPRN
ncbi:nuclear transport factor 2 family protein [Nostoc sp. CHAB 5784]|uniref:nuclear transport factor 2 family protein n=1 Tax=Nostoc mirabile TaxID=2907820 RepID=UPI001E48E136|nr:nuclear transport factor 2 family protein [Nostoc mirabile]MCC5668773.1 nuclear transport factor 2 family protein [Nostoc mirabile CHAB5784]